MAMVKKSVSLTDTQNEWIKSQIASGHYGNESEVVRELIRERQQKEQTLACEIEFIRNALIEAEKSGPSGKTIEDAWAEARSRRLAKSA